MPDELQIIVFRLSGKADVLSQIDQQQPQVPAVSPTSSDRPGGADRGTTAKPSATAGSEGSKVEQSAGVNTSSRATFIEKIKRRIYSESTKDVEAREIVSFLNGIADAFADGIEREVKKFLPPEI